MSLFPAFISARKRNQDSAPPEETAADSLRMDSPAADSARADAPRADAPQVDLHDNIFELLPPKSDETTETAAPEPAPQGRNVHPVDMTDLSRLSIDRDGRLYWDGKPVEVRRRISMSRAQIIGASIVAAFVVIGAIGSAIQGAVAARELACRLGWSADACSLPGAQPRNRSDIPA
jgi:hypothetical protein